MPEVVRPFDPPAGRAGDPVACEPSYRDRLSDRFSRWRASGAPVAPRTLFVAMWRGLLSGCPACGGAGLFRTFLKPVATCPACGQDWSHHNADDFPPYIVILFIGHVVVSGMISLEVGFHPPMWVHLALWLPLIILLGIGLLQPAKGAVIAYQWWYGMGGFGDRAQFVPAPPTESQKDQSQAR
jgi:uncharacterized protein (DUF983 family)